MAKKTHYQEYMEQVEVADEMHPDLEDKWCPRCGTFLVKGSINYGEGFHIDGCLENNESADAWL
jgi:ribosomal protein S27AE